MTVFTLANLGDTSGASTASTSTTTVSSVISAVLVTFAGAAAIALTSSIFVPGNLVTVVDAAGFPQRASSPITITVVGNGTIDGLANRKVTAAGGALQLMFVGGNAWQTVGHSP